MYGNLRKYYVFKIKCFRVFHLIWSEDAFDIHHLLSRVWCDVTVGKRFVQTPASCTGSIFVLLHTFLKKYVNDTCTRYGYRKPELQKRFPMFSKFSYIGKFSVEISAIESCIHNKCFLYILQLFAFKFIIRFNLVD
jgi:hypothetical protein